MSIGGSYGKSKEQKQTDQNSQTDPWAPTHPLLKSFIDDLGGLWGGRDTAATGSAIDDLIGELRKDRTGDTGGYRSVYKDLIDTPDRTGVIDKAYGDLQSRLNPVASGANLNITENPHLQRLMQQVGDDAANRVNAQFAAAGRDLSPNNSIEVGKGVTQAQLPLLMDQYNREQSRTDAAIRDLFGGGLDSSRTQTGMDVARGGLRKAGADMEKTLADDDRDWTTQSLAKIVDLEKLRSQLPFEQAGWLAELLYGAAGLGNQSQGTATSTGKKTGFGITGQAKFY